MNEIRGLSILSDPKYQCLPKLNVKRRSKSSNLEEINSLLRFSQSVLNEEQTDVPRKSYAETRDTSGYLYRPRGVVSNSRDRNRTAKRLSYPRGEATRHPPCSAHGPLQYELYAGKSVSTASVRRRPDDSSTSIPMKERKMSHYIPKDTCSLQPVQTDVSLLWEDRILDTVSSGTAWHVASNCTGPHERSRVTRLVRNKYGSCDNLLGGSRRAAEDKVTFLDHPDTNTQSSTHPRNQDTSDEKSQQNIGKSDSVEAVHKDVQSLVVEDRSHSSPDYIRELSMAMDGLQTCRGRFDSPTVVFGRDKVFEKQFQGHFPDQSLHWSSPGDVKRDAMDTGKTYTRGWRRWTALPNPVEAHSEWLPVCDEVEQSRPSTGTSSGFRNLQRSREGAVKRTCGHELLDMFEEWRLKWGITAEFRDVSEDQVMEYLHYPSDGVRLNALYHCARSAIAIFTASNKSAKKEGDSKTPRSEVFSPLLVFQPHLERCLSDSNLCMRVASAVLLTTLGQWSHELERLLLDTLPTSQLSEQWMALQCLAVQGVARPEVVDCLLAHATQSHSPTRRDKAMELLARLSRSTSLVYATVCEQLNSSGWQERLTACTVLPMLCGSVTKDVCDKLVVLMWRDWSAEVRHTAAEALGKLGRGKLIHDELCRRLATEDESIRLDALRKVVALSLMTAQMLPAFLTCFRDPHISVRIEACSVAAEVGLSNREVLDALLSLTEDPSAKVKAHALQCLGLLGSSRDDILDRMLWCMRFDRNEALRAEACEAICQLGVRSDKIVQELQMLVSHDDSELVVRTAKHTLLALGYQPKVHNKMEKKIAEEIKNLTTLESVLRAC